ncbi:unnamed protein product [Calicophoron daubneyi]|uniref:Paladin n=1 Tax=Calicophoron daubneyi TaxID=300641 RepID=A0AAV2TJS8_CALDB
MPEPKKTEDDTHNPHRRNKRAAVLLANFHEEYQILADELPEIITGRVSKHLREHPMISGKYCLVRDAEGEREHVSSYSADPNGTTTKQMSKLGLPILGVSQPSFNRLMQIVAKCVEINPVWLILNVRCDPCLFSECGNDWLPYAVRDYKKIQYTIKEPCRTGLELDRFEADTREQVMQLIRACQDDSFYFYDDITFFENQPKMHLAAQPDYLLLTQEVYTTAALREDKVRYVRMRFPPLSFPPEDEVDMLITVVRELCNEILPKTAVLKPNEVAEVGQSLLGFLITGRKIHDESIQLGMAMGYLILRALHNTIMQINPKSPVAEAFSRVDEHSLIRMASQSDKTDNKKEDESAAKRRRECQLLTQWHQRVKAGRFHFVRQVGRYLPFMVQIKEEVDRAIDDCGDVINLREEILETILEMESLNFSSDTDKNHHWNMLYENIFRQLERYYMLICFNAYLRDQVPLRFSLSFSQWMRRHPKLYHNLAYLDNTEWSANVDRLKSGQRLLIKDNSSSTDELCTQKYTGLANFRQLLGWPIYGACQPDGNSIKKIQYLVTTVYWTVALKNSLKKDPKQDAPEIPISLPHILWICLRDEYVIDYAGEICTWRIKGNEKESIVLKGISGLEMEDFEDKFAEGIKKIKPPIQYYAIGDDNIPKACATLEHPTITSLKRIFNQVLETTKTPSAESKAAGIPNAYVEYVSEHAEYHRVPVPKYGRVPAPVFDQILRLIVNNSRGLLISTLAAKSLVDDCSSFSMSNPAKPTGASDNKEEDEWQIPENGDGKILRIGSTILIFFCENGRERTSLAMAVAGLVFCHVAGFAFGYRVEEEERISLRDAKYTKGEFVVIKRLITLLPNGNQVKREVDYILDKCFESMSMMHFHIREEIYFSYVKYKEEKDPKKKEEYRRQSFAYLEEYFSLILFNAYLHDGQATRWKTPFESWMEKVTNRCDYMRILDNFGFPEFEDAGNMMRMRDRWRPRASSTSQILGIL